MMGLTQLGDLEVPYWGSSQAHSGDGFLIGKGHVSTDVGWCHQQPTVISMVSRGPNTVQYQAWYPVLKAHVWRSLPTLRSASGHDGFQALAIGRGTVSDLAIPSKLAPFIKVLQQLEYMEFYCKICHSTAIM